MRSCQLPTPQLPTPKQFPTFSFQARRTSPLLVNWELGVAWELGIEELGVDPAASFRGRHHRADVETNIDSATPSHRSPAGPSSASPPLRLAGALAPFQP